MKKKEYRRPTVVIESFTLTAHIASCGVGANSNPLGTPKMTQEEGCGWQLPNRRVIFTNELAGCKLKVEEGQYEGYCYNVPTAALKVFSS